MTTLIYEEDVKRLLTMEDTLNIVEEAFLSQGKGTSINRERTRFHIPGKGNMQLMSGVCHYQQVMGLKVYTAFRGSVRFLILLFSTETGDLLGVIQADHLGKMRTGAASGVATKHLAREDAHTVGMIGSGGQAFSQLEAICRVRTIEKVMVYSRRSEPKLDFCKEMASKLGIEVLPVDMPEKAIAESDIVVTITNARDPVLYGKWINSGVHVNAAGSNSLARKEIDHELVRLCNLIVVDSRKQARSECGDLLVAAERGVVQWDTLTELGDVVAGKVSGRLSENQITLFESQGLAILDVATAVRIIQLANEHGMGEEINIF